MVARSDGSGDARIAMKNCVQTVRSADCGSGAGGEAPVEQQPHRKYWLGMPGRSSTAAPRVTKIDAEPSVAHSNGPEKMVVSGSWGVQ